MSMPTLAVRAAMPVRALLDATCAYPTFHGAVPKSIGRLI